MTIECNEVEYCKMQVHYVADPARVKTKRQEAVVQFRKIQIPGFRKGKAPDYAIEAKLKKQIEEAMKRELIADAYDEILFETKIKSIGYPQIEGMSLQDSTFSCDMMLLKKPSIELKDYKGMEIPKPHQPYTAVEMAEKMLQELRVKYGDVAPYGENDFVQMGDKVTLDVSYYQDDKLVDGLSKQGTLYTVGENMFQGFDDGIVGMSAGEERKFDVPGGRVEVKIHMGMKNTPAPLDDALAKKAGFETYEQLQQAASGIASGRIQETHNQLVSQQIVKRLLTSHDFEVPTWLVSMEAQQIAMQAHVEWKTLQDDQKNMLIERARNSVKLALILDEIKDKEPEMNFSDTELVDLLKQKVAGMGQDPNKFIVETQKDGRLLGLIASMRNEMILIWLVDHSTIIE